MLPWLVQGSISWEPPWGRSPLGSGRRSTAHASHGDGHSQRVVGAGQHCSCFPLRGPGIAPVLPPPWQRQAAPVPDAWGNRGREQRWGGPCSPWQSPAPEAVPPSRAGASPEEATSLLEHHADLSRGTTMWYTVPSAEGLPRPLRCSPQPQGRATGARGQGWERGHGDLARSQRHCPAWPAAKGQCQH